MFPHSGVASWAFLVSFSNSYNASKEKQKERGRKGKVALSVISRRASVPKPFLLQAVKPVHRKLHRAHVQAAEHTP